MGSETALSLLLVFIMDIYPGNPPTVDLVGWETIVTQDCAKEMIEYTPIVPNSTTRTYRFLCLRPKRGKQ